MKYLGSVFLGLLFCCQLTTPAMAAHDFDTLLNRALAAYGGVNDYVCSFSKKELVRETIKEERNILFKYRKPGNYYLKWVEVGSKGVEAIYAEGKYGNKLVVHLGGFWSFFKASVDPRGSQALKNNRHPIMEAGIGQLLNLVASNYRQGKSDPESRIVFEGEPLLDGRKTTQIKAVFPQNKGYYGHVVQLYFDQATHLPVKVTVYGWNNEFLEEYRFSDLRLNAGLTDRDFDTTNPEYNF